MRCQLSTTTICSSPLSAPRKRAGFSVTWWSTEPNRHLQATAEGQRHRSEVLCRVIDKGEIVRIGSPLVFPPGVIAGHDRSRSQMRSDKFERRSSHRYPDIDQHEVDRSLDLTK